MSDLHLVGPWTYAGGSGYSFSNQFTVTAETTLVGIKWKRQPATPQPNKVYLALESTGQVLLTYGPGPIDWIDEGDDWWRLNVSPAYDLLAAVNYRVTWYMENVGGAQSINQASPTPDAPLTTTYCYYAGGDNPSPPGGQGWNYRYGITPIVPGGSEPGGDPDPDPYLGTFHNLAIWLQHGNPDLRDDSLPKLIYDALGLITPADQSTYGLREANMAGAIVKALQWLVANGQNIAGLVTAIDTIRNWLGGNGGAPPGYDFYGAIEDLRQKVYDLDARSLAPGWSDGAVLLPGHHTQVDSFPFSGQVGWLSGRALHRVHFDTSDAKHPFIDLGDAGAWVPGVGWWAAMLPDGSLTNRAPCEFADQWCWPVPSAAVGIVLWCHPAASGTLYAYATHAASP